MLLEEAKLNCRHGREVGVRNQVGNCKLHVFLSRGSPQTFILIGNDLTNNVGMNLAADKPSLPWDVRSHSFGISQSSNPLQSHIAMRVATRSRLYYRAADRSQHFSFLGLDGRLVPDASDTARPRPGHSSRSA